MLLASKEDDELEKLDYSAYAPSMVHMSSVSTREDDDKDKNNDVNNEMKGLDRNGDHGDIAL